MIEYLFGTSANLLLILLSLVFRIFRASHDALSDRGKFFFGTTQTSYLFGNIGWWPWHMINWAGRDLFIGLLYLYLLQQDCPWQTVSVGAALQYLLHDFFYYFIIHNRKHFRWGADGLSFPSLFKRIFKNGTN